MKFRIIIAGDNCCEYPEVSKKMKESGILPRIGESIIIPGYEDSAVIEDIAYDYKKMEIWIGIEGVP